MSGAFLKSRGLGIAAGSLIGASMTSYFIWLTADVVESRGLLVSVLSAGLAGAVSMFTAVAMSGMDAARCLDGRLSMIATAMVLISSSAGASCVLGDDDKLNIAVTWLAPMVVAIAALACSEKFRTLIFSDDEPALIAAVLPQYQPDNQQSLLPAQQMTVSEQPQSLAFAH